jgi:trehalose 6-phosphate phosphatase
VRQWSLHTRRGRVVLAAMDAHPRASLPHAATLLDDLRRRRAAAGRLLVALDFDGTLAPIVARPADAALDPGVGRALAQLARRGDTCVALVSGRALEDLRARVRVPGAYYAGNHGLEIAGPGVHQVHAAARAARPALARLLHHARARLDHLAGVEIEDKQLTASVHFRRAPAAGDEVLDVLHELHAGDPELRLSRGKMVIEIRPAVDWHKGAATAFLVQTLSAGATGTLPAIFVGDDVTDEDAFRELRSERGGIIVADPPPATTAAVAYLRGIEEVREFVAALARAAPQRGGC